MSLPHALGIIRNFIGGRIVSGLDDIQNRGLTLLVDEHQTDAQSPPLNEGLLLARRYYTY
ncbi:predicted protein [Sclerotinia sclerotiorum 1980 UF-70]|uniref:Uncharacterized protein n=2 Tax=Sclerotinia sclerotiorum (strain ATCC 18683 / 1980 / Ss-1) TaxID=665079 RepID=A7E612_SCLS1|nr:predicted protein [Sclerotinia sclerotiorum 1980 UF-70]APA07707.1 hypothetical protein sscle_03g024770 [Sclerotinia sclerotiorum 1980 UF-70]EDN91334.1 predicted protein [Sclerotinia sclerotiorum 1980 UF-70]